MTLINLRSVIKEEQKFADKFIYVASILYPLSTSPQIYQIFSSRDVSGVSLSTWLAYVVFTAIFLRYACSKRLKPLIISYALWFIVELAVVAGIVLFR